MAWMDDSGTLNVKLVYYGPAMSGKTTNLVQLHDRVALAAKGEIMVMETNGDRTLFFDAFPMAFVSPSGLRIKIKLYTVPGQVQHNSTRKAILSRADGVAFIADSQRNQSSNNGYSFETLLENLSVLGIDAETMPIVVQFNKRDLDGIEPEEAINKKWHTTPWSPVLFATATAGEGVLETAAQLAERVYAVLEPQYDLLGRHGLSRTGFMTPFYSGGPGRDADVRAAQ